MNNMLESFTDKITVNSVVTKLKAVPRPLDTKFDLPVNLETDDVIEWADVWILLHGLSDGNPVSWSLFVGENPWHHVLKTWHGKSCLVTPDLKDDAALAHIANELIEDLTENFDNDDLPELLRD